MPEIDFNEIKKWLEHGDIAMLAKEEKIHCSTAYSYLSGKSKNFKFIEKAMKKALENKVIMMEGIERLKRLSV